MSELKNKNSFGIGMQKGLQKQQIHIFTSHIGYIKLSYVVTYWPPQPLLVPLVSHIIGFEMLKVQDLVRCHMLQVISVTKANSIYKNGSDQISSQSGNFSDSFTNLNIIVFNSCSVFQWYVKERLINGCYCNLQQSKDFHGFGIDTILVQVYWHAVIQTILVYAAAWERLGEMSKWGHKLVKNHFQATELGLGEG